MSVVDSIPMSTWKWDWQHAVILCAFAIGLFWAFEPRVEPLLASKSYTGLLPIALLLGSGIAAFFKNPPGSPSAAVQQGEQDGFVDLGTLRAIVVGLFSGLVVAAAVFLLSGCLSAAPLVPVTSSNSAQIASCQATATDHNSLVVGDFVLTGSAGTLGVIGALEPGQQAKTDLAIGAAGAAGAAVLASSLIALTSSNYASNQCSSVLGPLPTAAPPALSPNGRDK